MMAAGARPQTRWESLPCSLNYTVGCGERHPSPFLFPSPVTFLESGLLWPQHSALVLITISQRLYGQGSSSV